MIIIIISVDHFLSEKTQKIFPQKQKNVEKTASKKCESNRYEALKSFQSYYVYKEQN
jgi:hypothetical protein